MSDSAPGGTLTLADDLTLSRVGYGALQLAGPDVFGPPSSVTHLRENIAAADLVLPPAAVAELDAIGR
jgi:hypothetical protein